MSNFISGLILNYKTTSAGIGAIIAAGVALAHGYPDMTLGQAWTDIGVIASGLIGIFSPDSSATKK